METVDKPVLVYSTFPSEESAQMAGGALLDAGLAACVNIVPGMLAIYNWQGKRHTDREVVMLIKTRASLCERAIAEGRSRHPYDNPAFMVLEIAGGSAPYLAWLMAQTAASAGA